MKVKLNVAMASPDQAWRPGDEMDVDEAEAKRLIEAGVAVPVKARREKAVASSAEKAVEVD